MSTIQTQNSSIVGSQTERVQGKRLWLAGLGAMVAAIIVNSLIRIIALATLPIPGDNLQLRSTPAIVIVFTIVGTLAATAIFALINRSARHPISTFRITATIVLVISFIPDFLILAMPHENLAVTGALIPMHIITYLICLGLLTGVAHTK